MKKILVIIFLGLILNTTAFADKKFEKDLKKVSKDNGFVDSKGKTYSIDQISDKNNTILVLAWNFFDDIIKNNKDLSNNFLNIKDLEK